jgi:hypothetical protein
MKREIVFKAKTETDQWIYGALYQAAPNSAFIIPYLRGIQQQITAVKVTPATVSESTGFFDKKGTPIFEGDILEGKSYLSRWVVVWKKGSFMLQSLGTTVDSFKPLHSDVVNLTVTGHIFDNPHADDDPVKLTHLYTGAHTAF